MRRLTRRFTLMEVRRRDGADLARDAVQGLSARPKRLPPVHFYDDDGSRLFEEITRAPEYYLTRAEDEILRAEAAAVVEGPTGCVLVELGSGSSRKTRTLIEALIARQGFVRYVAIDVSRSALVGAARELLRDFPALEMTACVADYESGLAMAHELGVGPKLVALLGSSIGNLDAGQAQGLLQAIARTLGGGDRVILGADLEKAPEVLEAAYNDAGGATARFNLNILKRINRELGGSFDVADFAHRAFYNASRRAVEMHLRCERAHEVRIAALRRAFEFDRGETIHTEDSRKYSVDELDALACACGLRRTGLWLDERRYFSVARFEP